MKEKKMKKKDEAFDVFVPFVETSLGFFFSGLAFDKFCPKMNLPFELPAASCFCHITDCPIMSQKAPKIV